MGRKSSSSTSSLQKRKPRPPQWCIDVVSEPGSVVRTDAHGTRVARPVLLRDHWTGAIVLEAIAEIMESNPRARTMRSTVTVASGSGGFSRVRLGAVIANALAWASGWDLRERGRRVRVIHPRYDRQPNITMPAAKR